MEIHFYIGCIKANGIENSSSLNIGTNLLIGIGSWTKSLIGNGKVNGDCAAMPVLCNSIDDRDILDTPIWQT